ncbi:hypothetical protein DFP72DRAFT_841680 [Ephemerocybe angulata]|uniref:Uncharacterized protein n=1 Tax=Ephemerocybe angulata TaxID=980116 RepID=A0A8H6IDM1_9AGAR|nr:hypothetical protein DFP72DRAFT_841680 [Tulosesus angulatus]
MTSYHHVMPNHHRSSSTMSIMQPNYHIENYFFISNVQLGESMYYLDNTLLIFLNWTCCNLITTTIEAIAGSDSAVYTNDLLDTFFQELNKERRTCTPKVQLDSSTCQIRVRYSLAGVQSNWSPASLVDYPARLREQVGQASHISYN